MKPFSPLKPIFLASIFILSLTNISDPDAFTHLSLGREIIKNLGFPLTEPFNYTAIDKPFAYPEWLFGVMLYAIYSMLSSFGVVIFKAGIITLTYFILFKDSELRTISTNELIAVVILFIVALFSRGRFVERPEILSNLFLAFTIFSLNRFFYNGKRYIYFVPIIFIIWANSHPSVITGLYPFAAFIIGGSIYAFLNKSDLSQWKRIKVIILLLFISIFCAMVNPYTCSIFIAPKGLTENIWRYMTAELAPPYCGKDICFFTYS